MKKFFLFFLIIPLVLFACSTPRPTVIEHTEYVTVRDSVYFRDTTVQYKIEKEYVKDYTGLLDTLTLSTGYADARAWVDTAKSVLAGEIKNKEKVLDIPVQVKEKATVRDSIVYKEVPVPVEIEKVKTKYPASFWWLWVYMIVTLALMALKLWFKFHP